MSGREDYCGGESSAEETNQRCALPRRARCHLGARVCARTRVRGRSPQRRHLGLGSPSTDPVRDTFYNRQQRCRPKALTDKLRGIMGDDILHMISEGHRGWVGACMAV